MRRHLLPPFSARSRFLLGVVWSVVLLLGASGVGISAPGVVLNEIYCHPKDKTSRTEFVELFNPTASAVPLGGWKIEDAVRFTFPAEVQVAPGGYVVVAHDPERFKAEFHCDALGPWKGKLKHSGETLTLKDAKGATVDSVKFGAGFPWPTAASGAGSSLVWARQTPARVSWDRRRVRRRVFMD